ncbi:MAG: hypothetical protein OXI01_06570 [Albidovulum sp.]|nr:hypothetical protein [Albidovulum sp.]
MPSYHAISDLWRRFQAELFPELENDVGPLGERHRRFLAVLDTVPVELFVAGLCTASVERDTTMLINLWFFPQTTRRQATCQGPSQVDAGSSRSTRIEFWCRVSSDNGSRWSWARLRLTRPPLPQQGWSPHKKRPRLVSRRPARLLSPLGRLLER